MLRVGGSVPDARSSSADNGTGTAGGTGRVNATDEHDGVEDAPSSVSSAGANADAEMVPQFPRPADPGKGTEASAAYRQVNSQSTLPLCTAARAPQIATFAKGAGMAASAQPTEGSTATNSTSGSSAAGNATGTVRGARSEKRDSAAKGTRAEQQVASAENGVLAMPVNLPVNVAAVAQAPVLPKAEQATPKTGITDPVGSAASERTGNSPAAEPQGTEAGSGGSFSKGTEAARTGVTAQTGSRNPVSTTKNELQDNETSEVAAPLWSESEESSTEPQPASLTAAGILSEEPQGHGPGQRSAEKGSSLVAKVGTTAAQNPPYQDIGGIHSAAARAANADAGVDKAHMDGGGQSTQENLARTVHGAAAVEASASTSNPVVAQPSGAAADASAWVRNPVGAHEAMSAASSVAAGATGTQDITAREAIASLDAAPAVGTPSWLHAASRQAEAGFQDPALGWVGVRADLNGGIVHATVVTSSSEAAQALSGHLPGLSSYLTEQQTPVATLTVTTSGGSGLEAGVDQSMQQSAGQNAEQGAAAGSQQDASAPASALPLSPAIQSSGFDMAVHVGEGRGKYISVMA